METLAWLAVVATASLAVACADRGRLSVTVTSELPMARVPLEVDLDFGELLEAAQITGHVDLNTLRVQNLLTAETEPHALSEDFQHGDRGRVSWVAREPGHRRFELRFDVTATRQRLRAPDTVPPIGTGDLLRYNAQALRPVALTYPAGLLDLTGEGRLDLVGCWNYAHRPGEPWDGVMCFPGVEGGAPMEFGELRRVRHVDPAAPEVPAVFSRVYMACDFADLSGDGLLDMVCAAAHEEQVHIFLNSGEREPGGLPVFIATEPLPCPRLSWGIPSCRVADLDGDGVPEIIAGQVYLRNSNPAGWPFVPAPAVMLDCGEGACFYDVDGDGRLDAVSPAPLVGDEMLPRGLVWRRGLGGDPPVFGLPQPLSGIDCSYPGYVSAVFGARRGLLVAHDAGQSVSFHEQLTDQDGTPRFVNRGQAQSRSAVISLSDQAWPCLCDWDGDGDLDLLVGGGFGWPRIVINNGSRTRPAFEPAQPVLSVGQPIRITRDEVLGGTHWHNMGYPYPSFVDWDGDGRPDLVVPNETNRIFWYKNTGTRERPVFGPRQQVICDGYPDGPDLRRQSAELAADPATAHAPYPLEESQPFYWRTGAGFADLNGDGLMDLITLDGATMVLTLFAQYRSAAGELRLRREGPLKLVDGCPIEDSLTGRRNHWTQSFRCVDWDGDGLVDIIWGLSGVDSGSSSIWLLRNCGSARHPVFEPPEPLKCFGEPIRITLHGPHPWVGDFDGDGRPDIVACVEWSVYPYYCHAALAMDERPTMRLGRARLV